MSEESDQSRIDGITTQWSIVSQAHEGFADEAMALCSQLLHRYRGAVYRYLLSIVREDDVAEELSQEFALKFLQGGFHRLTAIADVFETTSRLRSSTWCEHIIEAG